jgi:hypothetical protein
MDDSRFDVLVSRLAEPGSRRRVLGVLGISTLAAVGLEDAALDAEAKRRRRRKRRKGKKNKKGKNQNPRGSGGTPLKLREICTPGQSTCEGNLQCSSPTTRHSCSSTVEGVANWCCVPPGGMCTECDCCGDYYCGGDGTCIPNPEG